jgi:hypothetical protein
MPVDPDLAFRAPRSNAVCFTTADLFSVAVRLDVLAGHPDVVQSGRLRNLVQREAGCRCPGDHEWSASSGSMSSSCTHKVLCKRLPVIEWLLLAQSGRSHKGGYGITTRGAKRPSTICDLVKCNLRVSVLQIQCCQMCVY